MVKIGSRGRIRTCDLQVMSLTSYQTAPPCYRRRGHHLDFSSIGNENLRRSVIVHLC
jgi:hypothetical protein